MDNDLFTQLSAEMATLESSGMDSFDVMSELDEAGQELGLWKYIDIYGRDGDTEINSFVVYSRNLSQFTRLILFFRSIGFIHTETGNGHLVFITTEYEKSLRAWVEWKKEEKNRENDGAY